MKKIIGMIIVVLLIVSNLAQADVPVAIIDYKKGDSWSVAPESLQVISCDSIALKSHYAGDQINWFKDGVFFSDQPEIQFRPDKDTTIVTLNVTNSDGSHEDTLSLYRKTNNIPQFKSLFFYTGTDQKKFSGGTINTAKNQDVVITREYNNDDILKGNILAPPAAGMTIKDEEAGLTTVSTTVAFQNTGDYYNIEIQDKDLCGNFAPNVKFGLHVYTNTNPVAVISGESIGDESGVTLDGSESYDNDPDDRITYMWTIEGSDKAWSGKTATFKIPVGTIANVTLCVTDSNGGKGCTVQLIGAEITVNKKPVADMTGTPNEVVINTDFDLIATQSSDDSKIEVYTWNAMFKDPGTGTYIKADGFPKSSNKSTAIGRLGRVGEYRLELTVKDDGKPAGFPLESTKRKALFVLQEAVDPTPTPTPQPPGDNRTADQKMLEDSIGNALTNYTQTDQRRVEGQMSEVESLMNSVSTTTLQQDSDLKDMAMSFVVLGLYFGIFLVIILLLMTAFQIPIPWNSVQKFSDELSMWRFVGMVLTIFGEAVVLAMSLIAVMLAKFLVGAAPFDLGQMVAFSITSAVVSIMGAGSVGMGVSSFVHAVGVYSILLMIFAVLARFLGILLFIWHRWGLLIRFVKVYLANTMYPAYIGLLIFATATGISWMSNGGVKMGIIFPALIFLAGFGYLLILLVLFITKPGESHIKAPIHLVVNTAKNVGKFVVEAGALYATGGASSIGSAIKTVAVTKAANKLNVKLKERG